MERVKHEHEWVFNEETCEARCRCGEEKEPNDAYVMNHPHWKEDRLAQKKFFDGLRFGQKLMDSNKGRR